MAISHGAHGKSSEQVSKAAANSIINYLSSGVTVGQHLADQLLLPMALAQGGSMITAKPSNHMLTNIQVIESFLDLKIITEQEEKNLYKILISSNCSENFMKYTG